MYNIVLSNCLFEHDERHYKAERNGSKTRFVRRIRYQNAYSTRLLYTYVYLVTWNCYSIFLISRVTTIEKFTERFYNSDIYFILLLLILVAEIKMCDVSSF